MKKLLAMVLALVMTLSLAVSANAAFKDVKDINETYAESAEVLANLGVFKGYEDGSFNPKGDITRAEVAAIVYRIYTGDVKDVQAKNYETYNKFADMAGAGWAKGYIGYCANAAFIKGYPDGNFKPAGKVTGYEALAMILRAVGYDKNNEFTGADWALHVAQIAQKNGILDNVKGVDLNAPATREVVAELLFRAINVPMVSYTAAFGYQNVGLSTADNKFFTANKTLGSEVFGLAKVSGEISKVSYLDKTTQFTYTEDKKDKTEEVTGVDAGFENIGYEGYVWTVPGAKKTVAAVSTVYVTGESLGNSTNGTAYGKLVDKDNDAYIADKADRVYYNGVLVSGKLTDTIAKINNIGVKVDFIDNDHNGKTDVVVVTDYTVAQVAGIAKDTTSTGSNAVEKNKYYFSKGIGGYKASAVCCADELALDDLVTVVEYNKAIYVDKAEFTTDTFNAINRDKVGGDQRSYDIGDKTYLVSAKGTTDPDELFTNKYLNKKVDIYTDPYGHIIYAELSKADVNYLFVLKNDHTKATTGLTDTKVVFAADAKEEVIGVSKVDGETEFNLGDITPHIYSYTENTNGSYTLKRACEKETDFTKSYKAESSQWGDYGVNKSTKVIDLRTGKDNAVYTGYAEIPALTDAKVHCLVNADGWITLAYLVSGTNTEDLTADLIVFTTDANKEKKVDDETYFYLDVVSDGKLVENYELTEKQYDYIKDLGVGEYVYNEKGKLDSYTAFTEEWLDAKWSDGSIKIGDKTFKTISDDVVYKVLDITNGKCYDLNRVTLGDLGLVEKDGNVNVKAYLHYDKYNKAVTELYVIVGKTATGAATVKGTNPDYVYAVDNANNKITKHADADKVIVASDFVSEVKFNSYTAELKSGAGTKADPFKMVATGCIEEASEMSTLKVTAPLTNMTIDAGVNKDFSDSLQNAKGILNWVTEWPVAATNYNSFRVTNADGDVAYFEVTFKVLSHDSTVTPKDGGKAAVNEKAIKLLSSAANDTTDDAKVLTALVANLTIPETAKVAYADGKLTVTAECGAKTVYTVTFVESLVDAPATGA